MLARFFVLPMVCAAGCAGSARHVEFEGRPFAPVVEPSQVLENPVIPRGAQRTGRLTARCEAVDLRAGFKERSLVDIDCSEERLRLLLVDAASQNGADVLVARSCRGGSSLSCSGYLARSASASRASGGTLGGDRGSSGDYGASSVLVSFTPQIQRSIVQPTPQGEMRELPVAAPDAVLIGSLESRCADCSELSARRALRTTVTRIGAKDLTGVRCVSQGKGYRCVAEAMTPALDPDYPAF